MILVKLPEEVVNWYTDTWHLQSYNLSLSRALIWFSIPVYDQHIKTALFISNYVLFSNPRG